VGREEVATCSRAELGVVLDLVGAVAPTHPVIAATARARIMVRRILHVACESVDFSRNRLDIVMGMGLGFQQHAFGLLRIQN
jgi:hypothetical protein